MIEPVQLQIRSQSCWLSPARCLFWEERKTLVAAGFILGRVNEPTESAERRSSLDKLQEQILFFKAQRVLLLGGFPLPENNQYLEAFTQWRSRYPALTIEYILSRGNAIAESLLTTLHIQVHIGQLIEAPFVWVASRLAAENWEADRSSGFLMSGYEDPGYKKYGAPRREKGTPAFYLTPDHAKLPAFSRPQGADLVKPGKDQLLWLCHQNTLERKT